MRCLLFSDVVLGLMLFIDLGQAETLLWSDEFDGSAIDSTKWVLETGRGNNGWGNSELEYYTDRNDNARVENGHLVIEARREDYNGASFTSARMKTLGKFDFLYGRVEAKIKIPSVANGLWPAFWMLGSSTDSWPQQGEIDIFEFGSKDALDAGQANSQFSSTCHWEYNGHASYGRAYTAAQDLSLDYHLYQLEWNDQYLATSLDGVEFFRMNINSSANGLDTFHKNFFILLNMAVGGTFMQINDPNDVTAPLPGQMLVDYVRVYQG